MKNLFLSIVLVCMFPLGLFSANYYFSESLGNDAWSGSLPTPNSNRTDGPRKSLASLNNLLSTIVRSGDSVLLRRGDTWIGATGIVTGSAQGTSNRYIFIGAYGSGLKPTIQKSGTGEILLCRGSANGASSYLKFSELSLVSTSPVGSTPVGVYINESFYTFKPHHIILDGLYVAGCQSGMILYQNNIIVQNCLLEKNGNKNQGQGIFCSANDVEFKNNVLDSNGCGSFFVHSMYISQCNNILFENNEIKNADDGLKLRASTNLIIRNNRIHDTYIHTIHVGGDQSSGTKNVLIEGNLVYNAPQGLRISSESGAQTLPSEQITIRNNIFPAQVFISDNGPVKDVLFYNNLIHTAVGQAALLFISAINPVNLQIKNNIFYKTNGNIDHSLLYLNNGLGGIFLDHNLYYFPMGGNNLFRVGNNGYSSLATFRSIYSNQELKGQQGNPNFVSAPVDFHLTANSLLAIDKGFASAGVVDFDFENKPRPVDGDGIGDTAWDIGPYEFCCLVNNFWEDNTAQRTAIFPNPASAEINIRLSSNENYTIEISNLWGVVIMRKENQNKIGLSNLFNGIYFVTIRQGQFSYTKKIVKH